MYAFNDYASGKCGENVKVCIPVITRIVIGCNIYQVMSLTTSCDVVSCSLIVISITYWLSRSKGNPSTCTPVEVLVLVLFIWAIVFPSCLPSRYSGWQTFFYIIQVLLSIMYFFVIVAESERYLSVKLSFFQLTLSGRMWTYTNLSLKFISLNFYDQMVVMPIP